MIGRIIQLSRKTLDVFFVVAGVLFLLIGIVGIVLPLLPTTPFLLLSAFCFSKGSKKFHHWLLNHSILGSPIRDWERKKIIRKKSKILATVMMAGSSVFVLSKDTIPLIGKVSYSLVLISVLIFIWTRRSTEEL
ncbi:MAG TPA: DUF454 family protein [Pseudobdellovibrionaceae bacterium]|jgi:hypothetical protein